MCTFVSNFLEHKNMKKVKFIVVTVIGLLAATACTQRNVYESPENPVEIYSQEFVVGDRNWTLRSDASGPFYETILEAPVLRDAYFKGLIMVYLFLDYDTNLETQIPLPYTFYGADFSIEYEYDMMSDGTIAVRAYSSDGLSPGSQVFRVAIAWQIEN